METLEEKLQKNQILPKFENIANIFLIGGGVIFAISPLLATRWWVFLFFLMGHAIWVWHGKVQKDQSLITLNVAMCFLDIYAISVRF